MKITYAQCLPDKRLLFNFIYDESFFLELHLLLNLILYKIKSFPGFLYQNEKINLNAFRIE